MQQYCYPYPHPYAYPYPYLGTAFLISALSLALLVLYSYSTSPLLPLRSFCIPTLSPPPSPEVSSQYPARMHI